MSNKVLILHGWGGSDFPHWQSELASEIAKNYGTVSFPLLDNCHFPSKKRWIKQVKTILQEFKPDTVVCHSLANTLWFWLCQEEMVEIERLIMVSPPSLTTNIETLKTFFPCEIPQKLYAKKIEIIVSNNDPYITIDEAQNMAKSIHASLTIIKNAGHINANSGHGKWALIENLVIGEK
jgi:uncharacterized protein